VEEESVNSSDGHSVANQRGAGISDEISSEEEATVFEQKGESLEKSNGKEHKITSMVVEGETYKADNDANKNRIEANNDLETTVTHKRISNWRKWPKSGVCYEKTK